MTLCCTPRIELMAAAITGRSDSYFASDMATCSERLHLAIEGRRILVTGGAGSIGSVTILELMHYRPASIMVMDTSENNLAELVRHIRSSDGEFLGEFQVQPLDYGSPLAESFLSKQRRFDVVLSFAALKHVRSERDEWSLTRMLEVNLVKADRFLEAIRRYGHGQQGVFFVSTDKAANPVSLMGASKRAMELLLWAHGEPGAPASLLDGGHAPPIEHMATARFANVAFSDGSLPWSFLQRIEKRQPLACPGDVRRYLVSPKEAGHICLLGALICPHRHLLFPRLNPTKDLIAFTDIASVVLQTIGLEPRWYDDPLTARRATRDDLLNGGYPVVVTRSDTSGEKEIEEFIGEGEEEVDIGLVHVGAVSGGKVDIGALTEVLAIIDHAAKGAGTLAKSDLMNALRRLVPNLEHRETGLTLDGKM